MRFIKARFEAVSLLRKSSVLLVHAPVLNEGNPRLFGEPSRLIADNPLLEPDDGDIAPLPFPLNGLPDDTGGLIGGAEDIEDIDCLLDRLQGRVAFPVEDLLRRRVDGDDGHTPGGGDRRGPCGPASPGSSTSRRRRYSCTS